MVNKNDIVPASKAFPKQLPIYPVEQKIVFPGMLTQMMTNKPQLRKLIDKALEKDKFMGMLLVKDPSQEDPYRFSNMYRVGTVVKIHKKIQLPDGGYNVFLMVLERFVIKRELRYTFPLIAQVDYVNPETKKTKEIVALTRSLISDMKIIFENNPIFSEEIRLNMINIDAPGQIADFLTAILDIKTSQQQEILEIFDLQQKLEKVLVLVHRELELLKIQERIHSQINDSVEKHRRNHFLREMQKEIKKELGEPVDGKTSDIQKFRKRIAALPVSEDIRDQLLKELKKLESLEPHHPEYAVLLGYFEKVIDLPWDDPVRKHIDLSFAEKTLNKEHYGMEKVKERIIEHLAISKIEQSKAKSILCLVGPPGVGKTSIAHSIGTALKKKLYHFSVGGMHDESEIKGHRRTYIGAMPGKIIQGLLLVKEKDPIFVIDEIDKLSRGVQGDPASALLEVLDPVQNVAFRDLYLDLPFDLSKIFFITTANSLHTIPNPLRNRMEIIELSGYIDKEKISIAQKYIVPKSLIKHGIPKSSITFPSSTLKVIAHNYAREAGMRHYAQYVDTIVRKVVTQNISKFETPLPPQESTKESSKKSKKEPVKSAKAKKAQATKKKFSKTISADSLESYLGPAPFQENIIKRATQAGTALGLAWTSVGGDVLVIESQSYPTGSVSTDEKTKVSTQNHRGKGSLILTGTLGDVMKESAHIALSLVKHYQTILAKTDLNKNFILNHDIHLHVPAGATPKDGPSAGITMASSLLSLMLNKSIKSNFAMTGELSLIGQVLPIGGLREKIVAANRNKIKNIIVPKSNNADLSVIPDYIKAGIKIHLVSDIKEVFALLFPSIKQLL